MLEALLDLPPGSAPTAIAAVCHPHPLFGGSMHNKVVHTLARATVALGCATLRFNFRGTGRSEGAHDGGVGETGDALAAVAHLRQRWPGLPLLLAGFSFGGAVAIRAAAAADPRWLVTVAPAIDRVDVAGVVPVNCPWLFVVGEADDVVDPAGVRRWAAAHAPAADVVGLPGVGHFFHGSLPALRTAVENWAHAAKKSPATGAGLLSGR